MAAGSTLDEAVLDAWLKGITYPVTWEVSNWTTDFSGRLKHSLRRAAARFYAKRYHAEHGRLPEGKHKVEARMGARGEPGIDVATDWHSSEWEPVLRVTITFPPAGSSR
jgi:hypothetical protein